MKILVTGGSGFIGTHLRKKLRDLGHQVTNYDIREPVPEDGDAYEFGDIANTSHSLRHLFKRGRFDVVYHLAAQTSVPVSVQNPEHDARANIIGTLHVLEVCREFGAKLIFASTAASYGNPKRQPVLEDDASDPQSPYGISKVACESYIRTSGVDYTILRFANVYGPGGDGLIPIFLHQAVHKLPLRVYGSGEQTRDFIYVKDLTAALIQCIDKGSGQTLNLSTNTAASVNGVIRVIGERFPDLHVIRGLAPRIGDIEDSRMSNDRAQQALGWQPVYTLATGITDMLLAMRAQMVLERE